MQKGIKVFSIGILTGLLVLTFTLFALSEEEKGLVGFWKFDKGEGTVVRDSSSNKNDGTIIKLGKYTKWVDGRFDKALEFDGEGGVENGGVVIKGTNRYDFSKGITIEAWVKLNDKQVKVWPGFDEIVTNAVKDRGAGFRFLIFYNSLTFWSGDGEKKWGVRSNQAKYPIKKNVWYHVAGTYDGSVFKVYINGEEAGVSEENLALTKGRDAITVGSFMSGYAYPFNGIIDEVKIYNYPKSDMDILQDAKGGIDI
ncbi:MAG: LamG domain-containing protein [bacterium]|nr:LamG domain-containing protein [bacterium]